MQRLIRKKAKNLDHVHGGHNLGKRFMAPSWERLPLCIPIQEGNLYFPRYDAVFIVLSKVIYVPSE